MESGLETITIPIAESIGVDVSKYKALLVSDNLYEKIDATFREEEKKSISVTKLPWQWSWEYQYDILDDAAVVKLLDETQCEVGQYVVRAMTVRVDDERKAIPKIKRRLVFVGKDLTSFHADGEVPGLALSYLKIMPPI
jgi:hypothetical protein